jgi:hypothetical protein
VRSLLSQATQGALAPAQSTGSGALTDSHLAAKQRCCDNAPRPPDFELLERTTKGEDRQYRYRARWWSQSISTRLPIYGARKQLQMNIGNIVI